MKVLFTGAGSIGTRHIGNLILVCRNKGINLQIDVIRKTGRILPDELKRQIRNEVRKDSELDEHYDIVFITDETKTHYDNIIKYKNICNHMFIEKPILDNINYPLNEIVPPNGSIYYVAAPIRFTNYFHELKKCVDEQNIYSARIIFSSYMPDWQKGRDYRKSFRCFNERGGGVDIDSLHEIDYMTALFGIPESVHRVAGKYSDLEMEACDIATYIFQYKDKIVEMHLDYFGKKANRKVEFLSKDDVIIIDFNKKVIEKKMSGEITEFGPDDDFYQKEMDYFISMVFSKGAIENINPIENAINSLKLAKGII